MENRFLEMDDYLKRISGKKGSGCGPQAGNGANGDNGRRKSPISYQSSQWSQSFSAAERALVILIENGGVDLGIPELVTKLFSVIPKADLIPEKYRQELVAEIKKKLKGFTDNLIESFELSVNRYSAAKPEFYGDVVILRDGTASYQDLKNKLIALSSLDKIIDLLILTHGRDDSISVKGGVTSQKIKDMKAEYGKPLNIRSVYMMNCVGSSLNQAWLEAGARASCGSILNNYLPEPTMFFFWNNWKAGQTFEAAATSAYRQTITLMNEALRQFFRTLNLPFGDLLVSKIDLANWDFVRDSAPMVEGQRSVTITTDNLSFAHSLSSGLATTVLPASVLKSLSVSKAASNGEKQSRSVSPEGIGFIKGWEGFRDRMYNDPVGHCTIGYGTLLHTGSCDGSSAEQPYLDGVSEEKATQLLAEKAGGFQRIINDSVTVGLNQNQNDSLVSFVYNVGGGNFRKSTLLRLLNEGNYGAVPTELKKWTKARQNGKLVDLPGLVKRRIAEAELFQKPETVLEKSMSTDAATTAAGELSAGRQNMLHLIDKWIPTSLLNPRKPVGEPQDLLEKAGWTKATGVRYKKEKDDGLGTTTSCGDVLSAMLTLWKSNFVGAFAMRDVVYVMENGKKKKKPGAKELGYYVEADKVDVRGDQGPKPGDILVFRNGVGPGTVGTLGHTGILYKLTADVWYTADGGGGSLPDQTVALTPRTVEWVNNIPILKSPTDSKKKQLDGWVDLDRLTQTE